MHIISDFLKKLINFQKDGKFPKFKENNYKLIFSEVFEYKEQINDPYYICSNNKILSVFDLSWLAEESGKSEFHILYVFSLYILNCINFHTFRANLQEMYYNNSLEEELIVSSFYIEQNKKQDNKNIQEYSFFAFLEFCRLIGIPPLSFTTYEKIIRESFPEIKIIEKEVILGNEIDKVIEIIRERPEYIEETAKTISPEILIYLDFYLDYLLLNRVSYQLSRELAEEVVLDEPISLSEFQKKIEKKFKENKMPQVPTVVDPILQPNIKKIKPKTVKIEDLADLPQEQLKEFASIRAYSSPKNAQKIRISFLGGGKIGNMGILVQHDNNAILIDCGMSVANNAIPYWYPSLEFVNSILITHAHLDHTGGLPFIISPENGKRWYSSPSTKTLTERLLFNTANIIRKRLSNKSNILPELENYFHNSRLINLFNSHNSLKAREKIEISPGFTIIPYQASHLFGSYGYEIDIYGQRILFTGDFSLDSSELFPGAKFPTDCDITIFDGTYYNRTISSENPDSVILQAVENTDRLLIPAFSVGRTQEMIKKLEKLGVSKDKNIITTGMAGEICKIMGIKGNYDIVKDFQVEDFVRDTIIIAGHGMLQGGTARRVLENTKEDSKTGVILCGYQAPNTLGYALKNYHPIALQKYHQTIYNAHVSGHSSPDSLNNFIEELEGKKIMVHTPEQIELKKEHKDIIIPEYLQTIEISRAL